MWWSKNVNISPWNVAKKTRKMQALCTYPGILSHSSSVNLPSYSAAWWTMPAELELVWLLCFVRRQSFGLSNISDALWRYVPEKKSTDRIRGKTDKLVIYKQQAFSGPHLGYHSLRQTLSYPRSSLQSLYWAEWLSRPRSVYWSSGSLSGHPLCHLKTQLLCPEAIGHQILGMNNESNNFVYSQKSNIKHHFLGL